MNEPFTIEQVAVAVPDMAATLAFYRRANFTEWIEDTVTLRVRNRDSIGNGEMIEGTAVAQLAFSYEVIPGKEFELIHFLVGDNFHSGLSIPGMSHMGLHVDNIDSWLHRYPDYKYKKLMEAQTLSHTSAPVVESGKRYKYVILDTMASLGFYLKLIQRIEPRSN